VYRIGLSAQNGGIPSVFRNTENKMKIKLEIRDIELATMKDGTQFHQVSALDCGESPLKQFITWNVMEQYKDDLKGLKAGSKVDFKITKIATNYDGSLKINGSRLSE